MIWQISLGSWFRLASKKERKRCLVWKSLNKSWKNSEWLSELVFCYNSVTSVSAPKLLSNVCYELIHHYHTAAAAVINRTITNHVDIFFQHFYSIIIIISSSRVLECFRRPHWMMILEQNMPLSLTWNYS